jgi:TonB family protein
VALLLVLLGGGGYAATHVDAVRGVWERTRPSLGAAYAGFIERLQVLKREATAKSSDVTPSSQSEAPAAAPASGGTAPASTAASTSDGSGPEAKSAVSAPQPDGVAAQNGTKADVARAEPKAQTNRESDAARAKREGSGDAAEPEILDAGVLRVPAAVMESNLIASRVPAYPETAKAEGIEGRVVMEARISKMGAVERVRVIEGDRHLRAAAEDAVMKWHYRPYLLGGRPVDVGTTVRVDFRLPRRMGR